MPSFNAFNALPALTRVAINNRVLFRKKRFLALQAGNWKPMNREILLVGDRPAPSAPTDPAFHYTPFGAFWNSSLWLNLLLERYHVEEASLAWVNAFNLAGEPNDGDVLSLRWGQVFALGGNANRWCSEHIQTHVKFYHPQAWKRFHGSEPYPLIGHLVLST